MANQKKQMVVGVFDPQQVDRIFRKAAFLKALSDHISIKEVRGWLADFEEVDMPPPLQTRNSASLLAADYHSTFQSLVTQGAKLELREFFRGLLDGNWTNLDKIRNTFSHANEYNEKVLRRLTFGQYTTAAVGLTCGVALIVLASSGTLVIATAVAGGATVAEATCFGFAIGGSAGVFTGATITTNIALAAARSWDNCESWSGIAYGGMSQAGTEAGRLAANEAVDRQVGSFLEKALQSTSWKEGFGNLGKAIGARAVGAGLVMVFAAQDLRSEANNFMKSLDSPQERAERQKRGG